MGRGGLTTSVPGKSWTPDLSDKPVGAGRGKLTTSAPGNGWIPDLPDNRDRNEEHPSVKPLLKSIGIYGDVKKKLPAKISLVDGCSPIEHQGLLKSCSAHAAVGLVEYLMRKADGKHTDASRLFVYKTSRNLLQWTDDNGAYLRTTIASLVLFGVPPEKYWPYDEAKVNEEPTAFCYSFAQNYKTLVYYRLDATGVSQKALLTKIKLHLAAGLPSVFGFTTFSSMASDQNKEGNIPFPDPHEESDEGHAVMAVGYDDNRVIVNPFNKKIKTTGALLIRNSYGTEWGDKGYGWLPYEYVLKELAMDWWCILKESWVKTYQFKL